MRATCHLLISGRVQGVGYREALRRQAQSSGCTGWVRNRADGSVEAIVQGPQEAIDKLIAWARRGPPAAQVLDVQVSSAQGDFDLFEVRPIR